MINIIRNLYIRLFGNFFDYGEFIFGILLGIFGAFIFFKLEPIRNEISGWFEGRSQEKGSQRKRVSADRYRSDLIAKAQSMHVARAIFSLEEILIPPRLLAPPITQDPEKDGAVPKIHFRSCQLCPIGIICLASIKHRPSVLEPPYHQRQTSLLRAGQEPAKRLHSLISPSIPPSEIPKLDPPQS